MLKHYAGLMTIFSLLSIPATGSHAQPGEEDGLGQTIQIYTRLHSFVGKPTWLLVIRDLDHGQNMPYIFDIRQGDNTWVIFTYSRHYLIEASDLQLVSYIQRENCYRNQRIRNFCQLESNGRIMKGESMTIIIDGDLSPYSDTYSCNVSQYTDSNFTIAKQSSPE